MMVAQMSDPAGEHIAQVSGQLARPWIKRHVGYPIGRLRAANQEVLSVKPDAAISEAVTLMMAKGFSQLPVMTTPWELKGILSWKSIGARLALRTPVERARDAMLKACEISSDASIFEAIPIISAEDYVLVRNTRITGIVTASDLSLEFQNLTEPFLLLGQIENCVRNLIGDTFSAEELHATRKALGGKPTHGLADLTFGEYIHLLQNRERWHRVGLNVDRAVFCEHLEMVRDIRNRVMHFAEDAVGETRLAALREFARFLKQLEDIGGFPSDNVTSTKRQD